MKNLFTQKTQSLQTALQKKNGQLRIIGGKWRGRKLPIINAEGLRPTGDRIRETLFNWLMMDTVDARCLDAFAGSGALGIEAASRHAKEVIMIEKSSQAAKQLHANIRLLNAPNIHIYEQDALAYLNQSAPEAFDLIFLDPPFRNALLDESINLLTTKGWIKENSLIYIEAEAELQPLALPVFWQLHKEKISGQVAYRLYRIHGLTTR